MTSWNGRTPSASENGVIHRCDMQETPLNRYFPDGG